MSQCRRPGFMGWGGSAGAGWQGETGPPSHPHCDSADRITSLSDALRSAYNSGFGYDGQDRLRTVLRSGDNQTFDVDAARNRTGHARAGASWVYTRVPGSHRLQSVQGTGLSRVFGYSASGEIVSETRPSQHRLRPWRCDWRAAHPQRRLSGSVLRRGVPAVAQLASGL